MTRLRADQLTVLIAQYAGAHASRCESLADFHEQKRQLHQQQAETHRASASICNVRGGDFHERQADLHRAQAELHDKQAQLCERIGRYLKSGGETWMSMQEYFNHRVPPHTVPGVSRELPAE